MDINLAKRRLASLKRSRAQYGNIAMNALTEARFDWASKEGEKLDELIFDLERKIEKAEREEYLASISEDTAVNIAKRRLVKLQSAKESCAIKGLLSRTQSDYDHAMEAWGRLNVEIENLYLLIVELESA